MTTPTTPTAPSAKCWSSVRGKVARFTRLDVCGNPVVGPKSTLVTDGFVTVTFSPQYAEADEITVTKANGKRCLTDKGADTLTRFDVTVTLCQVNPALASMLGGYESVLDARGSAAGYRIGEDITTEGIALELWSDVIAEDECAGGGAEYGYFLAPRIVNAKLSGDVVIANDALSLEFQGQTKRNRWGTGPYNVVGTGANGTTPGKLLTPMGRKQHLAMQVTTIDPPEADEDDCGATALAA
jgi:hypothetical protein